MPDTGGWSERLDDLVGRHDARRRPGVRARIDALVDDFTEVGALAGDGDDTAFVCGIGRLVGDGRFCAVGAEDFTVNGGSIGPGESAKRHRIAELALQERIPLVMLLEGAGHRPPEAGRPSLGRTPGDLMATADASGRIPIAAAVLGASAGHGALAAPLADFSVMTPAGAIFAAGPPLVKAALGEDVTKETLGGPDVALASGLIHALAPDDSSAIATVRRWLAYLPSSCWHLPDHVDHVDHGDPAGPVAPGDVDLLDVVPADPRAAYDMNAVVRAVVDPGSWFEVHTGWGRSMLTGYARVAGQPVAVVANQPAHLAGSITTDAAQKATHLVAVADAFHLPLVFFTDNPGVLAGTASERAGILRHAARMFAVQHAARVPKVQVTLRKAYGFGSTAMAMNPFDHQTLNLIWPGVTLGAMPARGADDVVGADAERAAAMRAAEADASYRSARNLSVDAVIHPNQTRAHLVRAIELGVARSAPPAFVRPTAWSR